MDFFLASSQVDFDKGEAEQRRTKALISHSHRWRNTILAFPVEQPLGIMVHAAVPAQPALIVGGGGMDIIVHSSGNLTHQNII